jgi:predicted Rdx family selenoprotein
VLYIFDGKGTPVYQENFSETLGALATKPATGGTETLLVGGNGQVWEYQ